MTQDYQIINSNPTYMLDADQWIEHGYVFYQDQVIAYEIDRKEQTHMLFGSQSVTEFLESDQIDEKAKEWLSNLTEKT